MTQGTAEERISALRAEILLLDIRLSGLMTQGSKPEGGGRSAAIDSPAPWNAPVALCRLDLHALVRELERDWRIASGLPVRERGGSDENTRKALDVLVNLCLIVNEATRLAGERELSRWLRHGKMVLGEMERPRRLPDEEVCPFCQGKTLRMWAGAGIVRCVAPDCKKEDGQKPVAHLEYRAERIEIVWQG